MRKDKKILITGGTGYIGSHTSVVLMQAGFDVIILDNLSNSSPVVLERIAHLTGRDTSFFEGDVLDCNILDFIFSKHEVSSVIHFAGLKSIGKSLNNPLDYYNNNVNGTVSLCKSMQKFKIFKLIFSSSATVYGDQERIPISEDQPTTNPKNPYGRSKLMIEKILEDLVKADPKWCIGILRYFNPIGAHESGLIGEDTKGIPENLIPYLMKVALRKLDKLLIFGDDYATIDGTGVRDYIHIIDLAKGHLATLEILDKISGLNIWNLGTGHGHSVLQIIKTFEKVSGLKLPYEIVKRRHGDIASSYANPEKAFKDLKWTARYNLHKMIEDAWRWQRTNPNGYK